MICSCGGDGSTPSSWVCWNMLDSLVFRSVSCTLCLAPLLCPSSLAWYAPTSQCVDPTLYHCGRLLADLSADAGGPTRPRLRPYSVSCRVYVAGWAVDPRDRDDLEPLGASIPVSRHLSSKSAHPRHSLVPLRLRLVYLAPSGWTLLKRGLVIEPSPHVAHRTAVRS